MGIEKEAINGSIVAHTPPGTAIAEGFASTEMARHAETASTAVAAQAKAAVESRYIMALKRPRDMDAARLAILKECKRPGFAAVARYRKPVGEGVEGPSIRFAEAAIRCMTNMLPEVATIYEDPEKRIMRVSVTDLESNVTYSGDVTIEKTVERTKLKDGQVPLRSRVNSVGKPTYLVEATEDDLLNKQNALVSKQLRTLALRLIPGDILEEAMAQVVATLEQEDAKDPTAARKKLVDVFDGLGVKPSALRDYLGHDLDGVTTAELADLRAVAITIRDGEARWVDVLDHKLKGRADVAGEKPSSLKERAKAAASGGKRATVAVDADGVVVEEPTLKATGTADTMPAREPGEEG